ncbi:hypothetical protein [Thalassospira alkalitolerans]|uniref:hypothetical protein n=1 Tax=Thalassospira alkalitolerans TaxID=1293890 RepID=UPI003AA87972
MKDFFDSVFEAWSERIRSPILGSIAIVYLLLNWQPLFYVFFGKVSVLERFQYYNCQPSRWKLLDYLPNETLRSYIWSATPILLGLTLAFLLPWVRYYGATLAKSANAKLSTLQENEASRKRIREYKKEKEEVDAKAALDASREEAQLAKERRTKQAEEIGEGASERLQEVRATENSERGVGLQELDDAEQAAIFALGASGSETLLNFTDDSNVELIEDLREHMGYQDVFRLQTELQEAALRLAEKGLVTHRAVGRGRVFRLTSDGYSIFDELKN